MTVHNEELISATICTRNRCASVVDAISSLLSSDHRNFELVIVDQSTDDQTQKAIQKFLPDSRIKYIRSFTVGKARALNIGMRESRGDIVAITDDDCIVPTNWLGVMGSIFETHPRVAVAFCNVSGVTHDSTRGFIPAYTRRTDFLATTIQDKRLARGIGAGMAVRRSYLEKLGGFDDFLGPGGMFPSAEERDISIRALLSGYQVYETALVAVEHFGFRTWEQGKQLTRRDFVAIGAAYAKPLKCGRWDFLEVAVFDLLNEALLPPLKDMLKLRRPRGLARISSFVLGFYRGLVTPVDKTSIRFIEKNGA